MTHPHHTQQPDGIEHISCDVAAYLIQRQLCTVLQGVDTFHCNSRPAGSCMAGRSGEANTTLVTARWESPDG